MTRAVTRGAQRPLVVGDMPFGSYQVSDEEAVAQRDPLRQGGGRRRGQARGRRPVALARARDRRRRASRVMGHIGLTPQSATCSAASRRRAAPPSRRARSRRRARARGGRLLRDRARGGAGAGRRSGSRGADGADDRHRRRRAADRRPGARLARPARPLRGRAPRFVKRYADLGDGDPRGARSAMPRTCASALPGGAAHLLDAGRGARAFEARSPPSTPSARVDHAATSTHEGAVAEIARGQVQPSTTRSRSRATHAPNRETDVEPAKTCAPRPSRPRRCGRCPRRRGRADRQQDQRERHRHGGKAQQVTRLTVATRPTEPAQSEIEHPARQPVVDDPESRPAMKSQTGITIPARAGSSAKLDA